MHFFVYYDPFFQITSKLCSYFFVFRVFFLDFMFLLCCCYFYFYFVVYFSIRSRFLFIQLTTVLSKTKYFGLIRFSTWVHCDAYNRQSGGLIVVVILLCLSLKAR